MHSGLRRILRGCYFSVNPYDFNDGFIRSATYDDGRSYFIFVSCKFNTERKVENYRRYRMRFIRRSGHRNYFRAAVKQKTKKRNHYESYIL